MLDLHDFLFYFLATVSLLCGIGVIVSQNPIYASLFLALTMIGISGVFVTLDAWFVAGVQLIVYAGAVMVLFVMVLMLFDLKHEIEAFSRGLISGVLKLVTSGVILGLILGSIMMSAEAIFNPEPIPLLTADGKVLDVTKALADSLFTKYLFGFEVIGYLLLVIAIGAVALSRIAGGTHHVDE
jgi:NADH-quinone oxidoreductase subunit J